MLKLSFEHLFLDISFETDDSFAILGPNGSGKSLLLKIITHELHPQKLYKREVFNKKLTLKEARKIFGTVNNDLEYFYKTQNIKVKNAILSVFENALDTYDFHRFTKKDIYRVEEMCELFKLKENQSTYELSLGEIKKLLIARALAHKPEILCLDEPTNGLDIKAKYEFFKLLESINVKKILITHDFTEINSMYSKIIMLSKGKIFKISDEINKNDLIELFKINEKILKDFYG